MEGCGRWTEVELTAISWSGQVRPTCASALTFVQHEEHAVTRVQRQALRQSELDIQVLEVQHDDQGRD